jgi:hypothetical protein
MIDRVELQDKIRNYADNLIIDNIGEMEIAIFAEKAKEIVEEAFEAYVNEQYDRYVDNVSENKRQHFASFTEGYVAQMRKWIDENGISMEKVDISSPEHLVKDVPTKKWPAAKVAVGGTAVAAGLLILPKVVCLPACIANIPIILAVAIEILALGLAFHSYKQQDSNSVVNELKLDDMRHDMDVLKEKLVMGIWGQLDEWLDKAEEKSDSLIKIYINE